MLVMINVFKKPVHFMSISKPDWIERNGFSNFQSKLNRLMELKGQYTPLLVNGWTNWESIISPVQLENRFLEHWL